MPYVSIQFQSSTGNWTTVQQVTNGPHNIATGLRTVKSMYPESRVLAVDSAGRLVDMM